VILGLGITMVTLTSLSLSAIATNGRVKGGGAYYMISRSLGPSLGGGVGVIFYFANIFAGGTYMSGFVSALVEVPFLKGYDTYPYQVIYGTLVLFTLMLICILGADAFSKAALLIFIALWASLIGCMGSVWFSAEGTAEGYTSWSQTTFEDNFPPNFQGESFHSVFAVFFPAVTGIMAGANMSGDLKDPGHSIPRGTLSAIAVTGVFYATLVMSFGATVTSETLQSNFFIMQSICFWSPLFLIGVWLSTLSSALGSIIGSARIAQALAKDGLLPGIGWLAHESGKSREPRIAVLVSFLLIESTVFLGANVDLLASLTTMFFLLSYGFVNLACFTVTIAGAPNFRPSFRIFNSGTALGGALFCFGAMFFVQPFLSCVSIALVLVLIGIITWRAPPNDWGDITQALIYHQVRKYLLRLDIRKEHKKYWRPQLLLFVSDPVASAR
jgi:solute carrier family 12 (potassium/chloride transporters), member 9